jgi:hypothetical protein
MRLRHRDADRLPRRLSVQNEAAAARGQALLLNLTSFSLKAWITLDGVTANAQSVLFLLARLLPTMGTRGTIKSAKRKNPGIRSNHNTGNAIDLVVQGASMRDLAQ